MPRPADPFFRRATGAATSVFAIKYRPLLFGEKLIAFPWIPSFGNDMRAHFGIDEHRFGKRSPRPTQKHLIHPFVCDQLATQENKTIILSFSSRSRGNVRVAQALDDARFKYRSCLTEDKVCRPFNLAVFEIVTSVFR